jgi:hypothetical protein
LDELGPEASFEILRTIIVAGQRSEAAAYEAFLAFSELDFATIQQQYADALDKSVDELTDNEKKQAVMNAVLSNAEQQPSA